MMLTLRRFVAVLVAAFGFALPASAATGSTDYTDNWIMPSESFWGLNIIHQGTLIFATLYVYDAGGMPHFFSASEVGATSATTFSGTLYESRGTFYATSPYVAGPPPTAVGNLTLNFSTPNTGTLTYTVNGQPVVKQIQRFAFRGENLSGTYLGGMTATSICNPGGNQFTLIFDALTVSHSGSSIAMTVNFLNNAGVASTCVFSGTYSQNGRLGQVDGSYSCTGGAAPIAGTFTVSEIATQQTGFSGRFTGRDQFCSSHTGYFGGVKDVL